MEFLKNLPVVRTLRERGLLFPGFALIAVAGVLLHGTLNREPPPVEGTIEDAVPPAPPAPEVPFRAALEKTPLAYESDYWLQLSRSASENLVLVGAERVPGVLIMPGLAVTSVMGADALEHARRIREAEAAQRALVTEAAEIPASIPGEPNAQEAVPEVGVGVPTGPRLVSVDVEHEIALVTVPGSGAASFTIAADAPRPGAYVGAVTLARDGSPRITPGHVVSPVVSGAPGDDGFEVAMAFAASLSIAALVDLDGDLIGVAVEARNGVRVYSARALMAVVGRMSAERVCQAIEVTNLDEEVLKLLRLANGVLVNRVRGSAFAAEPPIHPGDVLLRWNGHDVMGVAEFATLYAEAQPGTTVPFRVLRNRRRVNSEVQVPRADCRPPVGEAVQFAALGVTVEWVERLDAPWAQGWRVLAVREDSPAAMAGLEVPDLIVGADGRSLVRTTARDPFSRFERRPSPMVITVLGNGRLRLLVVAPADE